MSPAVSGSVYCCSPLAFRPKKISSPLAFHKESLKPISFNELPISRRVNLGALIFNRAIFPVGCAEIGAFPQKTMAEMVSTDAFRNRDAVDDGLTETKAILRSRSSEFRADARFNGWESDVNQSKTMAEMVSTNAIRSRDAVDDGYTETQAILRSGSSEFGADARFNGWESAVNRSSKWLVAILFSAIILWRHDAEAMWALMGSVINSFLSMVLKRLLNHQRPVSAPRSGPGMPSSHAQSIFYATGFIVLSLVQWLGINALSITLAVFSLACGSYLTWLRVSQRLHTFSQVFVGALLGSLCSIIWFWSWHAFVLKAFISFLWVRIIVVIGAAGFCIGFVLYVVRFWLVNGH